VLPPANGGRLQPSTGKGVLLSMPLLSSEVGFAVAPLQGVEVGLLGGLARIGVEVRAGIVGRTGGLVAAAVSAGTAYQLALAPHAFQGRTGIDMSLRTGIVQPLLDVYLGYIPSERSVFLPDFPDGGVGIVDPARARVQRNELRLSLPVGASFDLSARRRPMRDTMILALVPEITLASHNLWGPAVTEIGGSVVSFRSAFTLFVVLRFEHAHAILGGP
jgi:hypothetical protein